MSRRLMVTLAAIIAALAVVIGVLLVVRGSDDDGPQDAADRFLAAWSRRDSTAMRRLATPASDLPDAYDQMATAVRIRDATFQRKAGRDGTRRDAVPFTARAQVEGLGEWRFDGALRFRKVDDEWRVASGPEALHRNMKPGMTFGRSRLRPERALILDAGGQPLTQVAEVIAVGVEPARIKDRAEVKAALQTHAGVDPARVDRELDRPGVRPDFFVPFVEFRTERYAQVRPALAPVPGIVFRRQTARITPSEAFSRHVIGRMGDVTAEQLKTLGPQYQAGDLVGRSGLEDAYEKQLAGTPSGEVRLLNADGSVAEVVHRFAGAAAAPLRTTLDAGIQTAAERALDGVSTPAAIVAVNAATGGVLAAASRPLDQPFNRAFAGRFPPGSTFKVVTTAAFLRTGITPSTPVNCPAEVNAGGRTFRNFEGAALGTISFERAFAESCNTAFVEQASKTADTELARAAREFGFGTEYEIGMPAAGGTYPEPRDDTEQAAAAIGQGRVQASPLHMATVAAAVVSGRWRPPTLVLGGGGRDIDQDAAVIEPSVAGVLRELTLGVVRAGTGSAAAVPGRSIGGKTGTAEFGAGTPPSTHAWFIGYEGDVAFAVLIEGGGVGGRVAAPVAAKFVSGFPPR